MSCDGREEGEREEEGGREMERERGGGGGGREEMIVSTVHKTHCPVHKFACLLKDSTAHTEIT